MSAIRARVRGIVEHGEKRGRLLGYPTANIAMPATDHLDDLHDGVYAGTVQRASGTVHLAAISIGTRPTFHGAAGQRLLEAFLLDFEGDLYDEELAVDIAALIRGQVTFVDVGELIDQIRDDVTAVRAWAADMYPLPSVARSW